MIWQSFLIRDSFVVCQETSLFSESWFSISTGLTWRTSFHYPFPWRLRIHCIETQESWSKFIIIETQEFWTKFILLIDELLIPDAERLNTKLEPFIAVWTHTLIYHAEMTNNGKQTLVIDTSSVSTWLENWRCLAGLQRQTKRHVMELLFKHLWETDANWRRRWEPRSTYAKMPISSTDVS